MPYFTTDAIVLRVTNYREADRMLSLLTPEHGRVDAVARGCRKPSSRLLSASQAFAMGEYMLYESKGKLSVRGAVIRDTFFAIASDYDTLQNAAYAAGWCLRTAPAGQEAREVFSQLLTALSHYAYGQLRPGYVTAVFLAKLSAALGIAPATERCARCGGALDPSPRWEPHSGGTVCSACAPHTQPIGAEVLEGLRYALYDANPFEAAVPDEAMRHVRALMMRFLEDSAG